MASKKKGGKSANMGKAFPDEIRAQAVAEMLAGESVAAIAKKYGTSAQTPRNWLNAATKSGGSTGAAKKGRGARRRGRPAGRAGRRAAAATSASPSSAMSRDERLMNAIKNAIREYISDIQL